MNTRVKIVKRGTLELPQRSELKHATVSSERETASRYKAMDRRS